MIHQVPLLFTRLEYNIPDSKFYYHFNVKNDLILIFKINKQLNFVTKNHHFDVKIRHFDFLLI